MENTILFLMSDNGGPNGNGAYNYPLRGNKGDMFDGGAKQVETLTRSQWCRVMLTCSTAVSP